MDVRVSVLVDGFNLYHSIVDAGSAAKWLDMHSLAQSFLPNVPGRATIESVYCFTALAHHLAQRKPGVVSRHQAYIEALLATGVDVVLGRFRPRDVWCANCKSHFQRREEKETDVAISTKVFELLHNDSADAIVIVSGDSDLVPAIRTARELHPTKTIACAFPYKRRSEESAKVASFSFRISKDTYAKHQLPDPVVLPDGREIPRPAVW